jgi:hypothetical protein
MDSGKRATVCADVRYLASNRRMALPPDRQRGGETHRARNVITRDDDRHLDWKYYIRGEMDALVRLGNAVGNFLADAVPGVLNQEIVGPPVCQGERHVQDVDKLPRLNHGAGRRALVDRSDGRGMHGTRAIRSK